MSKKYFFLVLVSALVLNFVPCDAKRYAMKEHEVKQDENRPLCKTKEQCLSDKSCTCWCSVQCGPRAKRPQDKPVYVEDDPNGKYCYCNQWDLDNYDEKCGKQKMSKKKMSKRRNY